MAGQIDDERAQASAFSSVVVSRPFSKAAASGESSRSRSMTLASVRARALDRRAGGRDQCHSSAPFRQTKASAVPRTATKTTSSTTAAVPTSRSTTASG